MDVLAYIRVSTDEQAAHGHSVDMQPARIRQYCEAEGLNIVGVICDAGVSGSVPLTRRPGGRELLTRLRAGEAEGVVVVRLDRLFRDALDGLQFFTARRAAQVISIAERIDTSTASGRFHLTIELARAQYERDLASERTTDNTRAMRQAGRVYGAVPYGLQADGGQMRRNPATWPIRQQIVDWRGYGHSLDTIRQRLREDRTPAPSGGRWWSKSVLANLIKTHDSLAHLPMAGAQPESSTPTPTDAEVLRATAES